MKGNRTRIADELFGTQIIYELDETIHLHQFYHFCHVNKLEKNSEGVQIARFSKFFNGSLVYESKALFVIHLTWSKKFKLQQSLATPYPLVLVSSSGKNRTASLAPSKRRKASPER